MTRLDVLIDQLRSARIYTEAILAETPQADWFRMPPGGVSHVAWQVGHLAIAEYRLGLERIRGRRDDDPALLPDPFLEVFGRGSVPAPDPTAYPPAREIRAVFDAVHGRTMAELAGLTDSALDEPPEVAHRLCATKLQILGWCARHEMVHSGQIALLRRQLGSEPLW
ncbi:DinB family protein [Tautonia plasticadhaerens]|uniref:DinB superfamily protein n=1 Tax=Tautonia plasticadhaerens TaxID=2527974 RepID=A0A518GXQ5_9BACT|nr:DinB family protein [Tautonia plasticadhaerens]QDV33370.1 DinB superfamily protein [Tautonia plasticadhaerens]